MKWPLAAFGLLFAGLGISILGLVYVGQLRKAMQNEGGIAYVGNENGDMVKSNSEGRPLKMGNQEWLTKFELTERSGKQVGSEQLLGQPYVAGFFFSTCPSICVRQNEKMDLLAKKFLGKNVRFVCISVDPEIDTPTRLSEYAQKFNADPDQWLFMTGEMDYIARVGAEVFQLYVERKGHPEKFVLVDAQGKIFGYYAWNEATQFLELQTDIEKMLEDPAYLSTDSPKGLSKPKPLDLDEE